MAGVSDARLMKGKSFAEDGWRRRSHCAVKGMNLTMRGHPLFKGTVASNARTIDNATAVEQPQRVLRIDNALRSLAIAFEYPRARWKADGGHDIIEDAALPKARSMQAILKSFPCILTTAAVCMLGPWRRCGGRSRIVREVHSVWLFARCVRQLRGTMRR